MTYQEFFEKYSYDRRADVVARTRFGVIYKAKSTKRDSNVYIRIMQVREGEPTLADEVKFVNALPENRAIVRYTRQYRFEEATGFVDCAVMEYFPLGNLTKVLSDWKLDDDERRGLRDRILEAAGFLRKNGVKLGTFDPSTIYVSEVDGQLYPHLTDLSGIDSADAGYDEEVNRLLPEGKTAEVKTAEVKTAEEKDEQVPDADSDEETEADSETESEDIEVTEEETEGNRGRKFWIISGVILTWAAIIALIYVLHVKRNTIEDINEETVVDTTQVLYPADRYAIEESNRIADSIASAKADSAARADSIARVKAIRMAAPKPAPKPSKPEPAVKTEPESAPATEATPAPVEVSQE